MTHGMVSPVASVSHVDPGRTAGSGSLREVGLVHSLLDIATMDRILEDVLSLTTARIARMNIHDKQFAIREAFRVGTITTVQLLPSVVTDTSDPVDEVHPYGTIWVNTATPEAFQTPGDGTWVSMWDGGA